MRSIFVSSLRSARPRLARAFALTIALLPMMLASPAALAASGTVIESFGSTSLVQVGSNFYFYPVGGSSGPLLKYGGAPVAVGQYPGWSYDRGGANGGRLSGRWNSYGARISTQVWNTDSNGNVVSNGTGGVGLGIELRAQISSSPVSNRI